MTGKPDSGARHCFSTLVSTDRLDAMRRSAMASSFSWDLSVACYSALYRKMVST
jgi:starch synthase